MTDCCFEALMHKPSFDIIRARCLLASENVFMTDSIHMPGSSNCSDPTKTGDRKAISMGVNLQVECPSAENR